MLIGSVTARRSVCADSADAYVSGPRQHFVMLLNFNSEKQDLKRRSIKLQDTDDSCRDDVTQELHIA